MEIEEAKEKMSVVDLKGEEMDLEQGDIQAQEISVEDAFANIQVRSFLWLKGKAKGFISTLYEWESNPFDCAMTIR
ncbi:hypothetical protein SLE2022_179150 [Rubroshorea leprosula]